MSVSYRHTQIGFVIVAAVGAGFATASYIGVASSSRGLMVVLVVLGAVLLLFPTLTTVVADGVFEVFFGPGLIRRRIDLSDIREVRIVSNPWYCGWGIRWIGRGWLWNVSGLRGVELELKDGRRFRVGTDEPELLAKTLREQ
ncbi:MAG: hypothetical protein HYY76_18455 [Acidobacteria bacterium]|nr:hypothetical protein [Acidobacteriota bacterium]